MTDVKTAFVDEIEESKKMAPSHIKANLKIGLDLDKELDEAAGWFGYYMAWAERSDAKLKRLELEYEVWEAKVERKVAGKREINDKKALTKDQMMNTIKLLPAYVTFKMKILDAKEERGMLKGLEKAFDKKVETIRTKCSNRRKETLK